MTKSRLFLLFLVSVSLIKAQQLKTIEPFYNYVFNHDSLKGFDEAAAAKATLSEQFLGEEFKVHMYQLKRSYINAKYNLAVNVPLPITIENNSSAKASSTLCLNSDFESSAAGVITSSNQIAGWTVGRGTHYPGPSGANSCNLLGYNNSPPVESELIVAPNGTIDPNIGSIYPIYSVFGNSAGNPAAEIANPQLTQGMFGDNFIRINSDQLGTNAYSIEKLSKTFLVSNNNKYFQFAFISVLISGHGCCDAGAFQIRLFSSTTNSLLACINYSASALSSACTNTSTGITFLNAFSGTPANVNNATTVFNKWQLSSIDLSNYIGQNITIEVVATDCTGGGHYGYVYFDAQCSNSSKLYCNGVEFPITSDTIKVVGCSSSNNTVCATPSAGPYLWYGPNGFSSSAECIVVNGLKTYTLYQNGGNSCLGTNPKIIKVENAPSLKPTSKDTVICPGSSAVLFVQGMQHFIKWSTGDTTNYVIVSPTVSTEYTVYTKDIYGCSKTSSIIIEVMDCTGLNFQSAEESKYHIYPNPNNGEFMITSTKSNGVVDFVIENALGQTVFRQNLSLSENVIKTKNLAAGLYYYSIYHAGVLVQKGKLKIN